MNSRKKTIIVVIIFGIATLALIYFVIYFLLNDIKKDSQAFVAYEENLVVLRSKIGSLKKFEKNYQLNQQNFEKIDRLFYNPEVPTDIKKFADFLRKTAEDSQILFDKEIPPPSSKKTIAADPWPFVTFQLTFQGSLSNVAKFLEKLESAPYLIEISNLTMKRLTKKEIEAIALRAMMEEESRVLSLSDISANLSIKVFIR